MVIRVTARATDGRHAHEHRDGHGRRRSRDQPGRQRRLGDHRGSGSGEASGGEAGGEAAPQPEVCLTLTVTPKMITADGRPDRVTVKVTAGKKRVRGHEGRHLRRGRQQDGTVERQRHGRPPHQPAQGRPDHDHGDRDQPAGLRPEAHRGGRGLPPAPYGLAKRGRYARPRGGCGRLSVVCRGPGSGCSLTPVLRLPATEHRGQAEA